VQNARIAIDSVDVVLFVVDGSVEAGGGDRYIVDLLTIPKPSYFGTEQNRSTTARFSTCGQYLYPIG